MEWLKKGLKATGRGIKKASKVTAEHAPGIIEEGAKAAATGGVTALINNHGDKIDGAVGKIDSIADKLEGGLVSKEQADRIEQKIDLLLAQQADHITQTDRTERKVDGVMTWVDAQRSMGEQE